MSSDWRFPSKATFSAKEAWLVARIFRARPLVEMEMRIVRCVRRKAYRLTPFGEAVCTWIAALPDNVPANSGLERPTERSAGSRDDDHVP